MTTQDIELQRETYADVEEVYSDPFGLVKRDNRNHRKKQQIILDESGASPGDSILEVGCGGGLHAVGYARHFDYTGIDLSDSLVKKTQSRIADGTVRQMDAMKLEFAADEFDAVFGTAILHHLPDPAQALEEWVRVTRPGGTITLMEPNWVFPKDLATTYLVPEEKHKRNMKPWVLRSLLDDLDVEEATVEPRIYSLPWPNQLHSVYDRIDDVARRIPVARWGGQMLLIKITC